MLLLVVVCAPLLRAQEFNIEQLTVADGLPQSQVFALLEDFRGRIWMGTQGGGACWFDGESFHTVGTADGLVDGYVQALAETDNHHLLLGTRSGLMRYNGRTLETVDLPGTRYPTILSLTTDVAGRIWIGTDQGLFRMQGGNVLVPELPEGYQDVRVEDVVVDSELNLALATSRGALLRNAGEWRVIDKSGGLPSNLVNTLLRTDSTLLLGLYGDGVVALQGDQITPIFPDREAVVLDLMQDSEGALYVATLGQGVHIRDPEGTWQTVDEQAGLPANQVRCLLKDSWGNIWMGTSGAGVGRFRGQQFRHLSRESGLPGKQVYSMLEVSEDHWVLGVADRGVWHYFPEQTPRFVQDTTLTSGKVKSLFRDSRGWVWAGTEGQGAYIHTGDSVLHLDRNAGMLGLFVKDFAQHENGPVYLATSDGGIQRVDIVADSVVRSLDVTVINRTFGLPEDRITQVETDPLGRVWFGTRSSGLGVLFEGNVLHFDTEDGLPSNGIRALATDVFGYLWVGTDDAGICNVSTLADTLGIGVPEWNAALISRNIYSLLVDFEQHLWVGSESGVDRMLLNGERTLVEASHYGPDQGFRGIETTANCAVRARDGQLWFGTIDGVNITHPSEEYTNPMPPVLAVDEVRLFYTPLQDTHLAPFVGDWGSVIKPLALTYEQNSLGFTFRGTDQRSPRGVQYRWRLQGQEDTWSPLSRQSSISYSNLEPGKYVFEVEAVNDDGVWTPQPERIAFEILRPFWQEFWFKLAVWVSFVLLIAVLVFLRVRRVKRKSRERTARLKLENSVLELEQKALRLQMNPHFIFNTLNSIQGLIAVKDEKTARLYLSKFSRLMRLTLENSREELISLDQELEALRYFLELEQFTHEGKFTYTITTEVEAEEWLVPPLLVQPFAENAILHGLLPKGINAHLHITAREVSDLLEIRVEDNGIGRAASAERNQSRTGHRSTGLQVTRERLTLLQQGGEQFESVVFEDLVESGQPAGTAVIIRVPFAAEA